MGFIRLGVAILIFASLACELSASNPCGNILRKVDPLLKNQEFTNGVLSLITQLKRKPTDDEISEAVVGSVDQWKGVGIYGAKGFRKGIAKEPGKRAHLRLNDSPEIAWQPTLLRLQEFETLGLTAEEAAATRKSIQSEIRASWSIEQLRSWASEAIAKFIFDRGRAPIENKKKNIQEMKELGVEYDQWTGTGSYKAGSKIRAYAMYESTSSAWRSVMEILRLKADSTQKDQALSIAQEYLEAAIKREENKASKIVKFTQLLPVFPFMPKLEAYFNRRADFASESAKERAEIVEGLQAKARKIFFSSTTLLSENDLIVRFRSDASLLDPAETSRLIEFNRELIPYLRTALGHSITNIRLAGPTEVTDYIRGLVDEHLTVFILKGDYNHERNDLQNRNAKFKFAALVIKKRFQDAIRRHFSSTRYSGTPDVDVTSVYTSAREDEEDGNEFNPELKFDEIIKGLPELQAMVMRMHYGQGLTLSQIANESGIPLGTLKSALSRGLAKLKERLESARQKQIQ